ncbi:hypothetical protein OHB01_28260 [Microbispora hainanensis]|uniref:Uncharacterized protein n=1 Tax=Microbispora hainanensis TaxID=568844 RepID=A0ABZ1T2A1_9ACTN|nr:hypothetical protein [Microbispora hainanensis]
MTRSTSGMSGWGRRRAKLSSVTCSGGTPSRISDLAASTMSRRPPWTAVSAARCPSVRGRDRCAAHLPFPSMTHAT